MTYYERRFRYGRHIEVCAECDLKLFTSKFDGHSYWTVKPCAEALAILEGAFFMSTPPNNFKASEFGHLPEHWYAHAMHALEVIGYHSSNDINVLLRSSSTAKWHTICT